jgi:hypothetical protein
MAASLGFGFARRALPSIDAATDDGTSDRGLAAGAIGLPRHGSRRSPRPPKRWRLFVGNGATSALIRESPRDDRTQVAPHSPMRETSEHAAPPPQPARGRTQSS